MAHKVFICHSSNDKLVADAACAALEAQRIPCWIAPRDILAGEEYGKAIVDALSSCQIVLLIFSGHANDSPQVRREIERAVSKGKIIVPFRIEDVMPSDAMEFALSNTHWLDALTPPLERYLMQLCDTIARLNQKHTVAEAPLWEQTKPSPEILSEETVHKAESAAEEVNSTAGAAALSQWQRVACTFTAPSKTFEDIKRGNRSWWLPLILVVVFSYVFFAGITYQVGWSKAVNNMIRFTPKLDDYFSKLPADQIDQQKMKIQHWMEDDFIANPAVVLLIGAIASLGLWGTINFVFGGKATFGTIFAVWMYAGLPGIIKALLGTIVLYAGAAPDSFNIANPAPTSVRSFLAPVETNAALYKLASWLDFTTIWMLVLLGIGIAAVAGVKRSSGYIAVFGWWALFVLFSVSWTAAMG